MTETLSTIRTEVRELLRINSSTVRNNKINSSVNRYYQRALASRAWPSLVRSDEIGLLKPSDTTKATFEANESYAPLPFGCREVLSMVTYTPAQRDVRQVQPGELARGIASVRTTTGAPEVYAIVGETVMHTPITTAETVTVTGNASNDNVATVRIWYRDNAAHLGNTVSQRLSGAFSTGVATNTSAAAGWSVERIQASADWVGAITLTGTTSSTELGLINNRFEPTAGNAGQRAETRLLARVWPVPDQDYKAIVTWRRKPHPLVNDDDVPEIPVGAYLVYAAAADLLRAGRKFAEAREMDREAAQALADVQGGESHAMEPTYPQYGNLLGLTDSR